MTVSTVCTAPTRPRTSLYPASCNRVIVGANRSPTVEPLTTTTFHRPRGSASTVVGGMVDVVVVLVVDVVDVVVVVVDVVVVAGSVVDVVVGGGGNVSSPLMKIRIVASTMMIATRMALVMNVRLT